jgi:OmpA-OmpF porin, OOP family
VLKFTGSMIVLSAGLLAAPAVWAQTNPSADELIKSLKPTPVSRAQSDVRGLHRLDSVPPATQEATPAQLAAIKAPPTTERPVARSAVMYVQFGSGSADLTPQAMQTLDELGKAITSNDLAKYHFRIEGHTDTVGSKSFNQELSERRAAAVVAYIKQKFGVDGARITPVGMGSDHLLVPTGDQVPEARNRCVQVVNLDS